MKQPVKVVWKPTHEYVVVRPRSASYFAVQDAVERFSVNQFYRDPSNPADRPAARRQADADAKAAASQRATEMNAAEAAEQEHE